MSDFVFRLNFLAMRRITTLIISILASFFAVASPSRADDWSLEDGAVSAALGPCTIDHKEACKTDCRAEFDQKYHLCTEQCLSKKCVDVDEKASNSLSDDRRKDDSQACIEIESDDCQANCDSTSKHEAIQCRRTCLQEKCPESSKGDIAREAMDPGKFKCSACKKEAAITCSRRCGAGAIFAGPSGYSGLAQMGCEELCERASCRDSC